MEQSTTQSLLSIVVCFHGDGQYVTHAHLAASSAQLSWPCALARLKSTIVRKRTKTTLIYDTTVMFWPFLEMTFLSAFFENIDKTVLAVVTDRLKRPIKRMIRFLRMLLLHSRLFVSFHSSLKFISFYQHPYNSFAQVSPSLSLSLSLSLLLNIYISLSHSWLFFLSGCWARVNLRKTLQGRTGTAVAYNVFPK